MFCQNKGTAHSVQKLDDRDCSVASSVGSQRWSVKWLMGHGITTDHCCKNRCLPTAVCEFEQPFRRVRLHQQGVMHARWQHIRIYLTLMT